MAAARQAELTRCNYGNPPYYINSIDIYCVRGQDLDLGQ